MKVKTRAVDTLQFGNEELDLSAVEQLFDASQSRAVGEALLILMDWIAKPLWRGKTLEELLVALDREIETKVPLISSSCTVMSHMQPCLLTMFVSGILLALLAPGSFISIHISQDSPSQVGVLKSLRCGTHVKMSIQLFCRDWTLCRLGGMHPIWLDPEHLR